MPTVLFAQSVRLKSNPYDFNGRTGVSHKATFSDGDDLITVKFPQDLYDSLDAATLEALNTLGADVEVSLHTPRMFTNDKGEKSFSLRAKAVRVAAKVGK